MLLAIRYLLELEIQVNFDNMGLNSFQIFTYLKCLMAIKYP